MKEINSYRQVIKSTSIFGGVQLINIIIRIIKSKFIALFLGPEGMGIVYLFDTTTSFVSGLTNFGLGISAVKDLAASANDPNKIGLSVTAIVVRRAVWLTGLLGSLVTFFMSFYLSQLAFDSDKYGIAFMWLSSTLLLTQLTVGQNAILQGLRKIRFLAKANLIGGILGLLISVPIYYFLRIDGIVLSIIIGALANFLIALYYSAKVKIEPVKISFADFFVRAVPMIKMGFIISVNGLLLLGLSYALRIIIARSGGVVDVGLYSVGFVMINTYVGMIFSAMSTDYFPRLCGVAENSVMTNRLINQQAEIAIIILSPILAIFILYINFVIVLLYSQTFLPISLMVQISAIGMFFKTASWAVAYIFIAKGDTKTFALSEVSASIYMFFINYLGYSLWGLTGLGVSFLVGYLLYFIQVLWISRIRYEFYFSSGFYKFFLIQFLLCVSIFAISYFIPAPIFYLLGLIPLLITSVYSYVEFNRRIKIRGIFTKSARR